jgi:hypothetical protein
LGSGGPSSNFGIRIVLTISGLVQIYSFAAIVFWSLIFGEANLAIPIVVSFFSTGAIFLVLGFGELVKGVIGMWKRYPIDSLRFYGSAFGIVPLMATVVYGGLVIVRATSLLDTTRFDLIVRYLAGFGVASLIAFTGMVIYDLWNLPRRGKPIPKIVPSGQGGAGQQPAIVPQTERGQP